MRRDSTTWQDLAIESLLVLKKKLGWSLKRAQSFKEAFLFAHKFASTFSDGELWTPLGFFLDQNREGAQALIPCGLDEQRPGCSWSIMRETFSAPWSNFRYQYSQQMVMNEYEKLSQTLDADRSKLSAGHWTESIYLSGVHVSRRYRKQSRYSWRQNYTINHLLQIEYGDSLLSKSEWHHTFLKRFWCKWYKDCNVTRYFVWVSLINMPESINDGKALSRSPLSYLQVQWCNILQVSYMRSLVCHLTQKVTQPSWDSSFHDHHIISLY